MLKYQHAGWHHRVGAAGGILLLIVTAAVPFDASARDTGPSKTESFQDGGVRKVEPVKRADSAGPTRMTATGTPPPPVRADDPKKKGGKCTPQQCSALKVACRKKAGMEGCYQDGGRSGLPFVCKNPSQQRAVDACESISCEGAC